MTHPLTLELRSSEPISNDLAELAVLVAELPAETRLRIEPIVHRLNESNRRRRLALNAIHEALGEMRLDMTYLLFDLEATRRERDALRNESA